LSDIYFIEVENVNMSYLVLQFEVHDLVRVSIYHQSRVLINDQIALVPANPHVAFIELQTTFLNAFAALRLFQSPPGGDYIDPVVILTAGIIIRRLVLLKDTHMPELSYGIR